MVAGRVIRVFVSYQDPLVAVGLVSALGRQPGVVLIDHCEFVAVNQGERACGADVIVADYSRGLHFLTQFRGVSVPGNHPVAPRVLVLTDRDSEGEIRHVLEHGAHGFLTLDCDFDELTCAVRALDRGARHIGAVVASRLANSVASELLTGRELDVLRLLVEGHPNKVIARHLNIAPGTVKSHMKGIFQKLGARNRTQVVTVAERRGLLAAGMQAIYPHTRRVGC